MVSLPKIDLKNPESVVKEIFDDDRWVKDEFSSHCAAEILEFGKALADSFGKFPQLDALTENDEQAAFVAGFVHGIFDDLLTSMKLLVTGKLMASGNLMRQAIEGVAVAILCSSRKLILVPDTNKKKPAIMIKYWESVKNEDERVNSNKAPRQLCKNCDALNISIVGAQELMKARDKYHQFSHPSMMALASRMSLGEIGTLFVGGSFDMAKLPGYKKEIEERTNLCRTLPNLIDGLMRNLKATQHE
ncbi:MAG TPA: hypothetical protein VIU46_10670 [Gallionellaceae bacterium]